MIIDNNIVHKDGCGFLGGFTALMSVYAKDDPKLFVRAITSIYENDLKPDAMVLVVDGAVPIILGEQIDDLSKLYNIQLLKLPKNTGLANALNAGLNLIQTSWVVRVDADDYNLPIRFSALAKMLQQNHELDLIGSSILEFESDDTPIACRSLPLKHEEICKFLPRRNPFNHMTVAYKLNTIIKCNGYPNIYLREDYALWVIMITSGAKCANLPDILVHANAGKAMYARRGGWRYAIAEYRLQSLMTRNRLKSKFHGLVDGIMRASVFIAPNILRKTIYERFLRQKIS